MVSNQWPNPPSPVGFGRAREEMRELLDQVKPKALREQLLKGWEKFDGAKLARNAGVWAGRAAAAVVSV